MTNALTRRDSDRFVLKGTNTSFGCEYAVSSCKESLPGSWRLSFPEFSKRLIRALFKTLIMGKAITIKRTNIITEAEVTL